jgi:hypothetical protein
MEEIEIKRTTKEKKPLSLSEMDPEQGYLIKWRPGLRPVPLEPYYQDPIGVPRGPVRTR